jgi:hypothetical protein
MPLQIKWGDGRAGGNAKRGDVVRGMGKMRFSTTILQWNTAIIRY